MPVWKDIPLLLKADGTPDFQNFGVELNRRIKYYLSNIDVGSILFNLNDIGGILNLAKGGTGASLVVPAADRILFYDKSGNVMAWLTVGSGLTISGTTISASLAAVILGTANQITVTDNGDGTYTLSNPQNLDTSADVTFDSATLDDLTASRLVSSDGSKKLVSVTDLTSWIAGTANKITVTNDGDGTVTLTLPENYDDLQFAVASGKVPAVNAPTWEAFTPNTSEYSFAVDDFIDLQSNELFHRWKEGSSAEFHLHVTTKAANSTGANRYAKFTIYIGYADINETWTETSLTAELTIATGTAALTHFLLDMGDVALTNQKIGCQVKIRVKRIAATGGTEYAGNIFINQAGAHLLQDTTGSSTESAK